MGDHRGWNRQFFERYFGRPATDAFRTALIAYWRQMEPSLRSERAEGKKSTSLVVWSLGLRGIYAEAEDPDCFRRLSDIEARLAVRYALLELNGFPSWLEQLAAAHPQHVSEVLGRELDAELAVAPHPESVADSRVQALRHGSAAVARLVQNRLLKWFSGPGLALLSKTPTGAGKETISQLIHV